MLEIGQKFSEYFPHGAGGLLPHPSFADVVKEIPLSNEWRGRERWRGTRDNVEDEGETGDEGEFYALLNEAYFEEIGPLVKKIMDFWPPRFQIGTLQWQHGWLHHSRAGYIHHLRILMLFVLLFKFFSDAASDAICYIFSPTLGFFGFCI